MYKSTQDVILTLENEYVKDIDNDVGEDGKINRDYVKQVKNATRTLFEKMCRSCGVSDSQNLRASYLNKTSIHKATLAEWLETTFFLFCNPIT